MPPAYVIAANVYFNGNTTNTVLTKTVSTDNYYILWDALDTYGQTQLTDLITDYGAALPITAKAGFHTAFFSGAVVGGNPTGLANDSTVYTASIRVNTLDYLITVTGSAAQTFTTLVTAVNADLTNATMAIAGGNLVVTNGATGTGKDVIITDGTLFNTLTGFQRFNMPRAGLSNGLYEALQLNKLMTGNTALSQFAEVIKVVGAKPLKPSGPIDIDVVYYDGAWKYLYDDSAVP